jgi:hypothetical protein
MSEGNTDNLMNLPKQLAFAMAKTLTQVVREAQAQVIRQLPNDLTVRGPWYLPTNRFGIHATFATPDNLSAEVNTSAWWLAKTETGEVNDPPGSIDVAVPSYGVQPDPRQLVPIGLRPRNLKNAVLVHARDGRSFIFIRTGKGRHDLKLAYVLEPKVRRPKHEVVTKPAIETINRRLGPLFSENLAAALSGA